MTAVPKHSNEAAARDDSNDRDKRIGTTPGSNVTRAMRFDPRKAGRQVNAGHSRPLSSQTRRAIASDAVKPGDSIPNRLTSPRTPCAAGP